MHHAAICAVLRCPTHAAGPLAHSGPVVEGGAFSCIVFETMRVSLSWVTIGVVLGLYWGLYWDNGKENGKYYV